MRMQDVFMLALTMWRENRGHGREGMQSVANVILNRAAKHSATVYAECVRPMQFSSITARGDAALTVWPGEGDVAWPVALELAQAASDGQLEDITNGALYYYAPAAIKSTKSYTWLDGSVVPFPANWDAVTLRPLCSIGGQLFFR
jgi:spore germination cell wall hydrolase CwlJ-like protein